MDQTGAEGGKINNIFFFNQENKDFCPSRQLASALAPIGSEDYLWPLAESTLGGYGPPWIFSTWDETKPGVLAN